jgi:hypothetical protein
MGQAASQGDDARALGSNCRCLFSLFVEASMASKRPRPLGSGTVPPDHLHPHLLGFSGAQQAVLDDPHRRLERLSL